MSKKDKNHYKQRGLTKREIEIYNQCLAQCTTCLLDGACELQDKIKKRNNGCKNKQTEK